MRSDENQWRLWLDRSTSDLKSANLLYDAGQFSDAIFHLQQANEKLVKALLLYVGFLTIKRPKENRIVKMVLGFQEKHPVDYSHRLLKNFVGDLEEIVPFIEKCTRILSLSIEDEYKNKLAFLNRSIKNGKTSIKKLKNMPVEIKCSFEEVQGELNGSSVLLQEARKIIEKLPNELEDVALTKFQKMINKELQRSRRSGIKKYVAYG